MSAPINDGGPAFPAAPNPNYTDDACLGQRGMTLRDYFAGKALAGLLADKTIEGPAKSYARSAYEVADAMLEARKPQEGSQ